MQANAIDLASAKRIAIHDGCDVIATENSLLVTRRSSRRTVAVYKGRGYRVVEQPLGPTVYSLCPTLNVLRWED